MPTGKPTSSLEAAATGGPPLRDVSDPGVSLPGPGLAAVPEARSAAEFVAGQSRDQVPREVLNVALPTAYGILRRMRMMHAMTGTQIRDQALLALDGWLADQGYPG